VIERLITQGRIPDTGGTAKESVRALGRVAAPIASIRCWANRLRHRRKRKAGERDRDERETAP